MSRKTVSAIMLTLLLMSMLTLAFNIQSVKAEGTIYIRADGSIDPSTTPISTTDNITYTLIDNIYDSIVIERDNIVVDGAGHEVRGTGGGIGIYLDGRGGMTLRNAAISNFEYAIWLNCSSNNSIVGNNITENVQAGIFLFWYSSNNTISGNNIANNYYRGIDLYADSSNNTISGNNITGNYWGIDLWGSSNNTISRNVFFNDGLEVGYSYDNVVVDNSVNGKPLVYLENASDCIVDDAGQVVLINCNNIIVENLNLSHATVGVNLWGTNNTKIAKNDITANKQAGILLGVSSNNTLYENNIANNGIGIYLLDHSSNNTIYGNKITDNDYGIWLLSYSSNNTISGNNITASGWHGIHFYYSSNNFIYHNSFVDNTNQVYMEGSANIWDDGYPSGGNYWSDYVGVDVKSGFNQDLPGSDCIGDTSYIIDADNTDHYPLLNPYGAPPPPAYFLTITATVGGTTDPLPGTYGYTANSTVQVTAIPEANYVFDYWELDDINVGSANPYSLYMDKDHTLKAVFLSSPFPPHHPPLSASISPLSASIFVGQSVTFASTVYGGYAPYSYQWYLNYSLVSGATSSNWTFALESSGNYSTGTYSIHLIVTDSMGNNAISNQANVTAGLFGDLNNDGKVDIKDVSVVARAFGSSPNEPRWNIQADVNQDGKINIKDVALVAKHFGQHYP